MQNPLPCDGKIVRIASGDYQCAKCLAVLDSSSEEHYVSVTAEEKPFSLVGVPPETIKLIRSFICEFNSESNPWDMLDHLDDLVEAAKQ